MCGSAGARPLPQLLTDLRSTMSSGVGPRCALTSTVSPANAIARLAATVAVDLAATRRGLAENVGSTVAAGSAGEALAMVGHLLSLRGGETSSNLHASTQSLHEQHDECGVRERTPESAITSGDTHCLPDYRDSAIAYQTITACRRRDARTLSPQGESLTT